MENQEITTQELESLLYEDFSTDLITLSDVDDIDDTITKNNEIINESNFGTKFLDKGFLFLSWDDAINSKEQIGFQLLISKNTHLPTSSLFSIGSRFGPAEAYDREGNIYRLDLTKHPAKETFTLFQNEPNPFKDKTAIRFSLPGKSLGKLTVFDITGTVVYSIEQNFEKGINEVIVESVPKKGILFYQLDTDFGTKLQKMIHIE